MDEWFKGCTASKRKQVIYKDAHLIEQYCAHINVPLADYQCLLRGEAVGAWKQHEHFQPYQDKFNKSTELKALKKSRKFKALDKTEGAAEIAKRYLAFVQGIERDKLYHFVMASDQVNPVLIIRSPTGTKEIKKFLGYEWSSAKGDEGIKLIEDARGKHLTTLYDGPDHANPIRFTRDNPAKLNHHITANFLGTFGSIPEELSDVANPVRLVDMLEFSRPAFEKQLSLVAKSSITIDSKWPLESLANVVDVIPGQSPASSNYNESGNGLPFYQGKKDFGDIFLMPPTTWTTQITKKAIRNDILMSVRAPVGDVNICQFDEICIGRGLAALRVGSKVNPKYLYEFINQNKHLFKGSQGATFESISAADLREKKIPVPSANIQNKIVSECENVDNDVSSAKNVITKALAAMNSEVESIYASNAPRIEVAKVSTYIQYGLSKKMNEAGIGYKIFRMNEIVQGRMMDNGAMKCADISAEEFATYRLNKGDLLFNRTNSIEHVGKTGLFDLDGDYCFASYLVRVVPDTDKVLPLFLVKMMNSQAFQVEAKGKATKSINQANINATVMKSIKVPVPSLVDQKQFVSKVKALEKRIVDAQEIIGAAPGRKNAVMTRYL